MTDDVAGLVEQQTIEWVDRQLGRETERLTNAREQVAAFELMDEGLQGFTKSWAMTAEDAALMLSRYKGVKAIIADSDEWREQHENLLSVRQSDLTALSSKPAAPDDGLVEYIARMIAPSRWDVMDRYLAQTKRKYAGQDVMWPIEQYQDTESMKLAAAILAALSAKPAVGDKL
jgi:hypothetical protein